MLCRRALQVAGGLAGGTSPAIWGAACSLNAAGVGVVEGCGSDACAASTSGRGAAQCRGYTSDNPAMQQAAKERAYQQLQQFNMSIPGLQGQTVLAKVIKLRKDTMLVDPGFYGLCVVPRKDLGTLQVYDEYGRPQGAHPSTDGSGRERRRHARVGDYVRLRVGAVFTPYGDMQLDPMRISREVRNKLVWRELEEAMRGGRPVQGRVLNVAPGGYAVGVAGYVALLPRGQVRGDSYQSIGTLQHFYVKQMDSAKRLITLTSYGGRPGPAGGGSLYSNVL